MSDLTLALFIAFGIVITVLLVCWLIERYTEQNCAKCGAWTGGRPCRFCWAKLKEKLRERDRKVRARQIWEWEKEWEKELEREKGK